jgi:hypothetical protein
MDCAVVVEEMANQRWHCELLLSGFTSWRALDLEVLVIVALCRFLDAGLSLGRSYASTELNNKRCRYSFYQDEAMGLKPT